MGLIWLVANLRFLQTNYNKIAYISMENISSD